MIQDTFDPCSEPVITPRQIYGEQKRLCDACVVTFSKEILENALALFPCRKIAEISACNGAIPIYALDCEGKTIAFYLTPIGSAMAANSILEANWLVGAERFVMFGSAGCLDREKTAGKLVVPTAAYRDEGMSYHYAPPSEYIPLPGASRVASFFEERGVPYVLGKTWTTDAFYRETRAHLARRREEGCLTVEMEVAGAQAVCSYHGLDFFNFLMTGDALDLPEWSKGELNKANHHLANFDLALAIACNA